MAKTKSQPAEAPPVRVHGKSTLKDGKLTKKNSRVKSPDPKALKALSTPPPRTTKAAETSGEKVDAVRRKISFSGSPSEVPIVAEHPAGPNKAGKGKKKAVPMSKEEADGIYKSMQAACPV